MNKKITNIKLIQDYLSYDSVTGDFIWKKSPRSQVKIGDKAGHLTSKGYVRIGINYDYIMGHQAAWVLTHGKFPSKMIDHRDTNRANNAILNLREATRNNNVHNSKISSSNKSGFKGVYFSTRSNKWLARININKKAIHLGTFSRVQDAADAYKLASIKYHKSFGRT